MRKFMRNMNRARWACTGVWLSLVIGYAAVGGYGQAVSLLVPLAVVLLLIAAE